MFKKVIMAVGFLVLFTSAIFFLKEPEVEKNSAEDKKLKTVYTEKLEIGNVSREFKADGVVKDSYEVIDTSVIQGKVSKVFIKEGDEVKVGSPIVRLDTTGDMDSVNFQIKQLKSNISETKLLKTQMEAERKKQEKLFEVGGNSKADLENINNELNKYDLQIKELKEQLSELIASKKNVGSKSVIKSSCRGTITKLTVDSGEHFSQNDEIKIKKDNGQFVQIYLTEKYLKDIERGKEVNVLIDGNEERGVIAEILESEELLYPVKIKLKKVYKNGLTSVVTVPTYKNEKALLIDSRAVIKFDGEKYVYTVKDGITTKKAVELGFNKEGKVEIKNGLNSQDDIIVKGQFSIQEGEKVEVKPNYN